MGPTSRSKRSLQRSIRRADSSTPSLSQDDPTDIFLQQRRDDLPCSRILHGAGLSPVSLLQSSLADPSFDPRSLSRGPSRSAPSRHPSLELRESSHSRNSSRRRTSSSPRRLSRFRPHTPASNFGTCVAKHLHWTRLSGLKARAQYRELEVEVEVVGPNTGARREPWAVLRPSLSLLHPASISTMAEELPSKVGYVRLGKSGLKVSQVSRAGPTFSPLLSIR